MVKNVSSIIKYKCPVDKNLFYKVPDTSYYRMMNKKGEFVAETLAFPQYRMTSVCYPEELPCMIFRIAKLHVFEEFRRKGYGADFIKYFKHENYNEGCDGRVSLVAHSSQKAPHLFYWKQGFITPDAGVNNYFETCVKEGRDFQYFNAKDMFLPLKKEHPEKFDVPKLEKQPQGLKEKILGFIKNLFV